MRRAIADRYGVSPPLGRLSDMTRILADVLRERGYLRAAIAPRAEIDHAPERATIVFAVEPGVRTVIGEVAIVGAPHRVARAIFSAASTSRAARRISATSSNARIEKYVEERRRTGFYEARWCRRSR